MGLNTDAGILGKQEAKGREIEGQRPSLTRSLLRTLLYFDQGLALALLLVSDSRGRQLVVELSLPPYLAVLVTCCSTMLSCLLSLGVVFLAPFCIGGGEVNSDSRCVTTPLEVSVASL